MPGRGAYLKCRRAIAATCQPAPGSTLSGLDVPKDTVLFDGGWTFGSTTYDAASQTPVGLVHFLLRTQPKLERNNGTHASGRRAAT